MAKSITSKFLVQKLDYFKNNYWKPIVYVYFSFIAFIEVEVGREVKDKNGQYQIVYNRIYSNKVGPKEIVRVAKLKIKKYKIFWDFLEFLRIS